MFGDAGNILIDSWNVLDRFTLSDNKLEESSKAIIHTSVTKSNARFFFNPHCVSTWQVDPNLKFQLKGIGNTLRSMMTAMKQWFKDKNVLFCTNGGIVPDSPLLDSIATYEEAVDNNLLCIPGKNIVNNSPIFGLQAF